MEPLDIYIVRIYRRRPDGLDGIVEAAHGDFTHPFHSAAELWFALRNPQSLREHSSIDNSENSR